MDNYITVACATVPRLNNLKRNLPKVLPYVDKVVIICGMDIPEVNQYLESLGPKVEHYIHPWEDSFSRQYNHFFEHIDKGWVLVMDDDELPSEEMLKSLRPIIEESNDGNNFSLIQFQCNPIEVDCNNTILSDNGPAEYWREIFFKYNPGMRYAVDLHQCVVGYYNHKVKRRKEVYYHIKSDEDMHRNACRNWWIAGVWLSGARDGIRVPEWYEFKELVSSIYPEVKVFNDFNNVLVNGNMDGRIKDYLYKIKDIPDEPEKNRLLNELRSFWKYYFNVLHPNEKYKETQ